MNSSKDCHTGHSGALPPTMLTPGELEGMDLSLHVGDVVVIPAPSSLQAQVHPGGIVDFSPGGSRGSYEVNPGFVAIGEGIAAITLQEPGARPVHVTIRVTQPLDSDDPDELPGKD